MNWKLGKQCEPQSRSGSSDNEIENWIQIDFWGSWQESVLALRGMLRVMNCGSGGGRVARSLNIIKDFCKSHSPSEERWNNYEYIFKHQSNRIFIKVENILSMYTYFLTFFYIEDFATDDLHVDEVDLILLIGCIYLLLSIVKRGREWFTTSLKVIRSVLWFMRKLTCANKTTLSF